MNDPDVNLDVDRDTPAYQPEALEVCDCSGFSVGHKC